jgi:drug/metabolite transporter (DMT)-like permease
VTLLASHLLWYIFCAKETNFISRLFIFSRRDHDKLWQGKISMRLKEYLVLFALAALWGASFLFIKVAVSDMPPVLLVLIRLVCGALGLAIPVCFKPEIMRGWHKHLGAFALVAIFNAVIPYLAISWGELHVSSGMAAILNATTPLVLVIVSIWWPGGERLTWLRLLAVLIGFIGIGILVGPTGFSSSASNLYLPGILACFIGAASYAFGSLFAHKLLKGLSPVQQAIGQIGGGAIIMIPITGVSLAVQPLTHVPSALAISAALALALGGTSVAYLCYFWLMDTVGPTRTLIVTYLLPCMALVYGVLLLHESIGINAIAGLVLVLMGVFLAGKKSSTSGKESGQDHAAPPPERQLIQRHARHLR